MRFSPQRTHLVLRPTNCSTEPRKNQALFFNYFYFFQYFFNIIDVDRFCAILKSLYMKVRVITMKFFEKNPFLMIVIGVIGISLSSIFVKYSPAPSAVTAAWRLLWSVILLSPVVLGSRQFRLEIVSASPRNLVLSSISGIFLAIHFALWFESLKHTSIASSTTIVCTEVIWVSLGFWLLLKGRISGKAIFAIAVTLLGSALVAFADSVSDAHLYGDVLALLAAIAVAAYMLIGHIVREKLSTSVYTYVVYCACEISLLILCGIQQHHLFHHGLAPVIVGFLLAVFSTILGHSIFSWCLKFFSPSFVSASKLCEPVVAAILAVFLFGEIPGMIQIFGSILIISGVFYYSRIEKSEQH